MKINTIFDFRYIIEKLVNKYVYYKNNNSVIQIFQN